MGIVWVEQGVVDEEDAVGLRFDVIEQRDQGIGERFFGRSALLPLQDVEDKRDYSRADEE